MSEFLRRLGFSPRQVEVHRAIQSVGGYWTSLAGVARVLEEVAELGEHLPLLNTRYDLGCLEEELADLWIITTAIANQFLVHSSDEPASEAPLDQRGAVRLLLQSAGQIARAVNYYEGPKRPRTLEGWVPLVESIPTLQRVVWSIATENRVALGAAIDDKLQRIRSRDSGRFEPGYDPSTAKSLTAFEAVRAATKCTYAHKARLWGAPDWDSGQSVEDNARACVPSLMSFLKASPLEGLDAYVIQWIPDSKQSSPAELAPGFAEMLATLDCCSTGRQSCFDNEIAVPGWQFEAFGVRVFISVHSDVYSLGHVRHAPSGSFVLLQPEATFDRHGIGSAHEGSGQRKARVRSRFNRAEYPTQLIDQRIEAYLYLLPEDNFVPENCIRWWEHLPNKEES